MSSLTRASTEQIILKLQFVILAVRLLLGRLFISYCLHMFSFFLLLFLHDCYGDAANHCIFLFVTVQSNGVLTVSLDGNFGLVRKNNAGSSDVAPASLSGGFFLDSEKVDSFVRNYGQDSHSDKVTYILLVDLQIDI